MSPESDRQQLSSSNCRKEVTAPEWSGIMLELCAEMCSVVYLCSFLRQLFITPLRWRLITHSIKRLCARCGCELQNTVSLCLCKIRVGGLIKKRMEIHGMCLHKSYFRANKISRSLTKRSCSYRISSCKICDILVMSKVGLFVKLRWKSGGVRWRISSTKTAMNFYASENDALHTCSRSEV